MLENNNLTKFNAEISRKKLHIQHETLLNVLILEISTFVGTKKLFEQRKSIWI